MSAELNALRRRFDGHEPGLMGARREFAVLCPLVEKADGLHFLFEVRSADLPQGGEVCFPGGRKESGESFLECALRETEEELSIPRSEITILGTPDFMAHGNGSLLQPILGLISPAGIEALSPSPSEVSETFTVPLSFFRNTAPEVYTYDLLPHVQEDFPYEKVGITRDYRWARNRIDVPVWYWENKVIWGLTARIVRNLLLE